MSLDPACLNVRILLGLKKLRIAIQNKCKFNHCRFDKAQMTGMVYKMIMGYKPRPAAERPAIPEWGAGQIREVRGIVKWYCGVKSFLNLSHLSLGINRN